MNIKKLKIKNFRGYSGETTVNFDDLTAFVGKNDMGKSSVLEALDIFFNDSKGIPLPHIGKKRPGTSRYLFAQI